ncbi:MAG TPA: hypothetical protein VEP49_10815 [Acidimicrobiia bacterium]|nr:hypothetical protein [Acidimicrobiia bacterium]
MKNSRMHLAFVAVLAVVLLVALAVPAGAATPVVADQQFQWFYWVGFALALSFIGWLLMMAVGYYIKVLRPKWRGQKQS